MADEVIEYKFICPNITIYRESLQHLYTSFAKGLKCVWKTRNTSGQTFFSWEFDLNELKNQGIDGLMGRISVNSDSIDLLNVQIDLKNSTEIIERVVHLYHNNYQYGYNYIPSATFEYSFVPYYAQAEGSLYDQMFLPSHENDAILVIGKKKLHVCKAFLSYHSSFFRAIFSSTFKEGQMSEIPIKDVTYKDFALMLSTIYPDAVFPNDRTAEKLLEMGDRFIIQSVINHVEYHLLHNTKIGNEKLMWMADRYGMSKLLVKSIRQMDSIEKAKALKSSPDYAKLSKEAKEKILDRLMALI
ncbi:BTB domain-containing protein [Caenorhabditis elegans]|uniref:BTB domain-containing protein n=1 Tax=Caenorhabditis elegans TaxID=6239 RepID=O45594_CAEEL|nr:BTB domain-containing protein [Caenorhabditis elegans]CAB05524.1 BTB domain-containing protein [Caenorhabditis elegans]|eukprot:NP_497015.1 BTB (Broad/complex/Tramtrack/Bric a brac) domain protein [Caenorhabditis elegans]